MAEEEPKGLDSKMDSPEDVERKRKARHALRQADKDIEDKKMDPREAIAKAAADFELTPPQVRNLIGYFNLPSEEEKPERHRPETEEEVQAALKETVKELKGVRDNIRERRATTRADLEKKYTKGPLVQLKKGAAATFVDNEGNAYLVMGNAFPGKLPVGGSYNFGNRETGPQWKKWLGKDGGWSEATEDDIRKESEHPTLVQLDASELGVESKTRPESRPVEKPTETKVATPAEAPKEAPKEATIESNKEPEKKVPTERRQQPKKKPVVPEAIEGAPGVYAAKVPEGATWHQTPSGWIIRNQDGTVTFATPEQVKFREDMSKKEQEITDQKKEADKRFEEQQKAIAEQLQKATRPSFEKPPKVLPTVPPVAPRAPEAPPTPRSGTTTVIEVPVTVRSASQSWDTFKVDKKKYEGISIMPLESIVRDPEHMGLFYDLLDSIDPDMVRKDKIHILGKVIHGPGSGYDLTKEEEHFLEYAQHEFSKWYPRAEALAKNLGGEYKREDILTYAMRDRRGFEQWEKTKQKMRPDPWKSFKNFLTGAS